MARLSPALLFAGLCLAWLLQAATLGISDDEAYYWVLSRSPAFGYVYHPPLVAWIIALSERALGWISLPREFVVRFPGVLISGATLLLAADWVRRIRSVPSTSAMSFIVLPGLAAMTWMMVPDHSLLFGWMLCFRGCWSICESDSLRGRDLLLLALGAAIGLLSKFSAVLYCASAAACLVFFARRVRAQALLALLVGMLAAAAPILIWNSQHDWVALLYQFKSRHAGASFDWRRWGVFWSSQLMFAGPALLAAGGLFVARLLRERPQREELFVAAWTAPAVIFLVQPALSAFKPHWALVAWLPIGLWAALHSSRILARLHLAFASTLLLSSIGLTQFPLSSWITEKWTGRPANPLWDVSNDLAGWRDLPRLIAEMQLPAELPVVGSRYQTAAQAAFALWPSRPATLVPATRAERLEWPQLSEALLETGSGEWPQLLKPVLYVQDDRYSQEPRFSGAGCERRGSIDAPRFGFKPKGIHLWLCQPR
jgi:4-amino-4-deoxy-L-arabinose transferase-like glycosyltransferase